MQERHRADEIVWAGLAGLGMLCGIVWYGGGIVVGADRELIYFLTETGGLKEMIGVLLADTMFALTDGILFALALRYFREEQAVGTPFTEHGAVQIRRLGIYAIVFPLVSVILAASMYAVFDLPQNAGSDWSNLSSVTMGIILILSSLIFSYGAELEKNYGTH